MKKMWLQFFKFLVNVPILYGYLERNFLTYRINGIDNIYNRPGERKNYLKNVPTDQKGSREYCMDKKYGKIKILPILNVIKGNLKAKNSSNTRYIIVSRYKFQSLFETFDSSKTDIKTAQGKYMALFFKFACGVIRKLQYPYLSSPTPFLAIYRLLVKTTKNIFLTKGKNNTIK